MKKLIAIALSMTLMLGYALPTMASVFRESELMTDEENQKIVQMERQKRKEELQKTREITEEYADEDMKDTKSLDVLNSKDDDDRFTYIDEKLNIDCANEDFEELTEYFSQNLEGFDKDTCKIELVGNTGPTEEDYLILYGLTLNGFKTPYKVLVFIDSEGIHYSSNLDEAKFNTAGRTIDMYSDDISEDVIEDFKKKALKDDNIDPTAASVYYQKAEKHLDENLKPFISLQTAYENKDGGRFAKGNTYYLD